MPTLQYTVANPYFSADLHRRWLLVCGQIRYLMLERITVRTLEGSSLMVQSQVLFLSNLCILTVYPFENATV
ncbi:MAG: hypothetical protein OXG05_01110 [Gammaproteobacteria bacterium]|nr:hypothetical protein [Gammaproteobacteria bacterium]